MTQARLRECHSCKTKFYKTEGCNKMVCRCGSFMCYLCREKIDHKVGYKHFCQHPRDPGKTCSKCTKCNLFTNTEQDDEMAINEVKKQEEARLAAEGVAVESLKRPIGPPPENPASKKLKTGGPPFNPAPLAPPVGLLGINHVPPGAFFPGHPPPPFPMNPPIIFAPPPPAMFPRGRQRGRRN